MRRILLLILILVALAMGVGLHFMATPRDSGPEQPWQANEETAPAPTDLTYEVVSVTAGSKEYQLQIADSPEKQQRGLGLRPDIGGDGMIFPYAKPQELCFWMKDMKFSIDIIWLDADRRVLKVESDVKPGSYPKVSYCHGGSQYVVELASGEAGRQGITVGSTMRFDLPVSAQGR